jgi:predicted O-methyltransferase YrrM
MVDVEDMVGGEWYHYPGEIETLFELAKPLPPNPIIVNIGTGLGTSTLAFHKSRPDAKVYAIDIDPCAKAFENWRKSGLSMEGVTFINGASGSVARWWEVGPVDLLFIDGDHSPPGIRIDVKTWEPHIVTGGLLVFHDYGNPVTPYVKPAVDVLMKGKDVYLERGYIIAFRK